MATEFLFSGHELVNSVVTVATQRDRFAHLFAREILLEPFVAVAHSRNQMMLRRAFLW